MTFIKFSFRYGVWMVFALASLHTYAASTDRLPATSVAATPPALPAVAGKAMPAKAPSARMLNPPGSLSFGDQQPLPTLDCSMLRERGANVETFSLARPLRQDSRLVVYPYDKNSIYPINTYYSRYTHFEFEANETILGVYLNDETEWEQRVSVTGTDLFIRPRQHAVSGSVTVITSKRRYEMDLLDVQGCNAPRYQRVSWFIGEGVYEDRQALAASAGKITPRQSQALGAGQGNVVDGGMDASASSSSNASASLGDGMAMVNLLALNSSYTIEGDIDISPEQVMDDGVRTWLKFRSGMSRRPALFAVAPDGQAVIVEYAVQGSYFVASRLFGHGMLLKDGKAEVKIRNKASNCGWFDAQCKGVQVKNLSQP